MITTTLTIENVELEIEYTYFKGCKGSRDSFMGKAGAGPQLEPDEPASIEIESIKVKDIDIYELLSKSIIEKVEEEVTELISDKYNEGDYD